MFIPKHQKLAERIIILFLAFAFTWELLTIINLIVEGGLQ
jgi:hypothetical protein